MLVVEHAEPSNDMIKVRAIKQQWKEENNNITSLDARRRKEQQAALIKNHTWQARAMQLDAWLEAL